MNQWLGALQKRGGKEAELVLLAERGKAGVGSGRRCRNTHVVCLLSREVTWQGTHTGPLVGPKGTVPATGKQQTTRTSWVLNFDGGKIKESRHYFDMLSFMQQLGILPQ